MKAVDRDRSFPLFGKGRTRPSPMALASEIPAVVQLRVSSWNCPSGTPRPWMVESRTPDDGRIPRDTRPRL